MHHVPTALALACSAALLAPAGFAQILPGHSIAVVTNTLAGAPGEAYDIDHQAGTVSMLTLNAQIASERPNSVLMLDNVNGFIGTNPPSTIATTGDVYAIQVTGGAITEAKLNTTPTAGANVAQLGMLAGRIYFTTQDALLSTAPGILQSVSIGGGPVTVELDLSTIGVIGLANALTVLGGKVYVATFNSSPGNTATTPGELVSYDPTNPGTGTIVMNLPQGGFAPVGNPWNTGIVNMSLDFFNPGILVLQGVYGEILSIDPTTATVVAQAWTGLHNAGGNSLLSGSVNSFSFDPISRDWIVGTRYGNIERWVDGQQAEAKILGVGSNPTATQNSIGGIQYFPVTTGFDQSYGPGCGGNDGWKPTDSSFGPPVAGNSAFRFGLFSANGGDNVALLVDFQNQFAGTIPLPISLGLIGGEPSCVLNSGNLIALNAVANGAGPGLGQAIIPMPIPASALGAKIYRQWVELQTTPTNALGIVVSNPRQITVL